MGGTALYRNLSPAKVEDFIIWLAWVADSRHHLLYFFTYGKQVGTL